MNSLTPGVNTPDKVQFRASILQAQEEMKQMFAAGELRDCSKELTLAHYFSPIHPEYGVCTYTRVIYLPKDAIVVGKIHRHAHQNFIMMGKVRVNTEFGPKAFVAPETFVSEAGLKRAVYAVEASIWATVHITKHCGEEFLREIEDEVIAPDYETLGLVSNPDQLALAKKAIESLAKRKDEDIDEWAMTLANDVKDAGD